MQQPLELSQYLKVKTYQDKNLYLGEPLKIFNGTFKVFVTTFNPPSTGLDTKQADDQLQGFYHPL